MTEAENTLVTKIILDTATEEDFKAVTKQINTLNMFLTSDKVYDCLRDFNFSIRRATNTHDDSIVYLHIYTGGSGSQKIYYNIQSKLLGTYEVYRV